jgi:hypothetical protein
MNGGAFDGRVVIILPSKRMTTPLSNYRDIVSLLFRVVDPQARFSDVDRLLHKLHDVLSEGESARPPFLEPMFVQELLRPPTPPTLVIHPDQKAEEITAPEIVVKPEPSTVRNLVVNLPPATVHAVKLGPVPSDSAILAELKKDSAEEEDDDDETASTPDVGDEDEEEEDACSSDSESEPASDEEDDSDQEDEGEEEEDDIEEITIKKVKYYWSPSSKRVYEHKGEEGYGDLVGTYVDKKLVLK